ncbi:hypothetical protein C2E23DRAFT_882025 [Lenzites betulinus]|nr:hypothetical protein C2E23DRAFT_882025 [Lenzites betulinus]
MSTATSNQVPQTHSAPVSSASTPRGSSARSQSIHVVIPSSTELARLVTPTVTAGHGHGGSSIPSEDVVLSALTTPGHGHAGAQLFALPSPAGYASPLVAPHLFALPSPAGYASPLITSQPRMSPSPAGYASPLITSQPRMSARVSRRSSLYSASSADDWVHPFADAAAAAPAGSLAPPPEESEDAEGSDHEHDGANEHTGSSRPGSTMDAEDEDAHLRGTA